MRIRQLTRDESEWHFGWDSLKAATGDYDDYCDETGESWQYMGTVEVSLPAIGMNPLHAIVHQFRHRHRSLGARGYITGFCGDSRGRRTYIDIGASTAFAPSNGVAAGRPVNVRCTS